MRRTYSLLATFVAFLSFTSGALAEEDKCPKDEYACLDVINSSLCLSTNAARGTVEEMAKCVDYPGGMSDLPGAQKLCRCPGCHSASINEAIAKAYPPPCA